MKAEVVCDEVCQLGEGPFWFEGRLYWVDIERGQLLRLEGNAAGLVHQFEEKVGAVVPRSDGGFLAATQSGFHRLHEDGTCEALVDPESDKPDNRFNDGKLDAAGRFVAGTMSLKGEANQGNLYSLDPDFSCRVIHGPVNLSNGLAWSGDNRVFYYIDTPTQQVLRFDYDLESGNVRNPSVAFDLKDEDGVPDGMCTDSEGRLWIAFWDGWKVACFEPNSGIRVDELALPASQVTSCCLGGDDGSTLFITTASVGLSEDALLAQPDAGKLFRARL